MCVLRETLLQYFYKVNYCQDSGVWVGWAGCVELKTKPANKINKTETKTSKISETFQK